MTNIIVGNRGYTRQKLNFFIWETTLVMICTHRNRRQSNQVSVPRQITRDLRSVSLVKKNSTLFIHIIWIIWYEWYNNESNHSAITFPTVTVCLHSQHSLQRIQTNYSQIDLKILRKNDYIDVVDGCWRGNVLVTTMRYWWRFWQFWSPTSTIVLHLRRAPTFKICYQHPQILTNLKSLTSLSP